MKKVFINPEIKKEEPTYSYYSNVLGKVFASVEELKEAEAKYAAELKAKEEKAAAKKADAQKVEEAFKALNAARKTYKDQITEVTKVYSEGLVTLKTKFEESRKAIQDDLATAEANYSKALKEFTDAHPEGYHITLKDGDFETTISGSQTSRVATNKKVEPNLLNLFDILFNI